MIRVQALSRLSPPFRIAIALAALAFPAAAQEAAPDEDGDAILLETYTDYVISYSARSQNPASIGSAATVISADDIARAQIVFTADALKLSPGVAVARNGAFGGFASARLRGGSSGQTLVVIDGVAVNDPAAPQGGFNFGNLDVADIEGIEVLRGPQSLVWGADAIGGVIYVKTRNRADPLSAFAEGGSLGFARAGATVYVSEGDAYARATLSGARSSGVSRAAAGTENDGWRSLSASLRAHAPIGKAGATLTFRASDSRTDLDGFPPPFFVFTDTAEAEDTRDYSGSLRLDHHLGHDFDGALTLSGSHIKRENSDAGAPTFNARGSRLGAHYLGHYRLLSNLALTAGAEFETAKAVTSGVDESADAGAAFLFAETGIGRLTVSAGVRRDEFSNFAGATTARITAVYALSNAIGKATRLRASWGEGFRAPTLFELNFDQFGVTPNPNLRPERASGFDFGVEKEIPGGYVRATYFRQRVRDQIDFSFASNGYFNIGRVASDGVEFEAKTALGDRVELRTVYTFTDARDRATDVQILRTPRHGGSLSLSARPVERLSATATVALNGREEDFPASNDAFAKLDLAFACDISEAAQIFGRIENATDADYEDVSGYEEPGASVFAGVRVRL
jgi:vitamin B12 transporter